MERRGSAGLWNALTLVLLGVTAALAAGMVAMYRDPASPLNPFRAPLPTYAPSATRLAVGPIVPPATGAAGENTPDIAASPTATLPRLSTGPIATQTATVAPTLTAAISATPVATLVVIVPSGPPPTPTSTRSPFMFTVQGDAPIAVANVFNFDGCAWMGIGGQVFDLKGQPTTHLGYVVHLEGGGFDVNSLTGTQPQYGTTGYAFKLADAPKQTSGVYRIQLRDPANAPVSDWIPVNTFADCARNVLLVNFLQNH